MSFTYPTVSDYRRKQMMAHAQEVLATQQTLAQKNQSLQHFMLAHHGYDDLADNPRFIKNRHFPSKDRIDYSTGAQYFYHCHRENIDTGEHGHFHTFIRGCAFPKTIKRSDIPEKDAFDDNPMTHLICIALDVYGQPCRLFTVNRWVSKEVVFSATQLKRSFLKRFTTPAIDKNPEWKIIDKWVVGMMHLFRPQIEYLLQERDHTIAQQIKQTRDQNIYMNTALEELSSMPISLQTQIEWLIAK